MNRKENMKGKKEGKKYNTCRKIKINKKNGNTNKKCRSQRTYLHDPWTCSKMWDLLERRGVPGR